MSLYLTLDFEHLFALVLSLLITAVLIVNLAFLMEVSDEAAS